MKPANPHAAAQRHLSRRCPVMKALIQRIGPCTLTPMPHDAFTLLVRCVITQQISTKAAQSIFDRLATAVGGPPIGARALAALDDAQLAACGISGPKRRTLRALTAHLDAHPDLLPGLATADDATLREQLTAIKGIGPWSVDMFLIFGLGRPDVLPIGDLGLKLGIRDAWGLAEPPSVADMIERAEPWRPYRSIATWYLWKSR